ncbi:MAG: GTPase domain-containing protein [Candidatus Lokiarchaeota archaeon]|nr:GTPase domain-containing protein [Candidatus Lokiarchaeota archaeon]
MIIDHLAKTISIKIVYFGPAMSGKTTSIKALFSEFGKEEEVCSIESTIERTLFFDYGTVTFQNQEWKLKIHIYTTTGQDFYFVTRPITLRAVDGVIFVIDSHEDVYDRNLISWNELIAYFKESIDILPIIIAFNKQDLEYKFNSIDFLKEIRYQKYKKIDTRFTSAIKGEGIIECFEDILKQILKKYYDYKLISAIN